MSVEEPLRVGRIPCIVRPGGGKLVLGVGQQWLEEPRGPPVTCD